MKHLVPFNTPISEDLIKNILLYILISHLFLYEAKCDPDIKVLYFFLPRPLVLWCGNT